jgi:Flp pilus assembly protein TadD
VARGWGFRLVVAVACLFLTVAAVRTVIADAALDEATNHLAAGECRAASADARTALAAVATHPKAYEVLGWCHMFGGREKAALEVMREAARLDPTNWRYRYGLAIARGAVGRDPRPDLRQARRLNPRAQIFTTRSAAKLMHARRARWKRLATTASRPTD